MSNKINNLSNVKTKNLYIFSVYYEIKLVFYYTFFEIFLNKCEKYVSVEGREQSWFDDVTLIWTLLF